MKTQKFNAHRVPSLDMIRGYAALVVVIAHTSIAGVYRVEPLWSHLKWSPLRVIWAGHQAVIVFLMLSGFALAHMYGGIRGNRYLSFAAARITRLYPPFIASLTVAIAGYWILAKAGNVWEKGWLNTVHPVLSREMVMNHLTMIGTYDTSQINPPIWSIVHEMRISLLFPIIWLSVGRLQFKAVLIAVATSIAIGIAALSALTTSFPRPVQDWLLTLHYSTFFVIGAWFYLRRENITRWALSLTPRMRAVTWIVALGIAAYPFDNPWSIGERIFGDLGSSIGIFILMALSFTISKGPAHSIGHWLGKISFSLYLNHYFILNACIILLHKQFGAVAVWICTIGTSMLLAAIMHAAVESPSQHLARRLRRRLAFQRRSTIAQS